MSNLMTKLRDRLRQFLGLHALCTLPEQAFYERIAHQLMYTPRIFGERKRLEMGEGVVLNDALINTSSGRVILHDWVFCGHGVSLLTGTHDPRQRNLQRQTAIPAEGRDIIVGEGTWLASNVTVLGPCVIGSHSVVAAGSVVVGDVEANSVYAGVPARKVRDIDLEAAAELRT